MTVARANYYRTLARRFWVPDAFLDDAVQEMTVAVWRQEDRPWRAVARSACIDFLRRLTRYNRRTRISPRVAHLGDNTVIDADADARLAYTDDRFELVEARVTVQRLMYDAPLTPNERLVLYYHYHQDLRFSQIAPLIGLSESRVSQFHARAIRKLRMVAA